MNILCITHADFEGPGSIADWADAKNHEFTICKPYAGDDCLEYDDFDFLILMGGAQTPLKLDQFPYLSDEIKLIKQAIQQEKIVLGFCLGAQLIGEAQGAKTARSPEKEIGVFPISLTPQGIEDPLFDGFSNQFPVIHWHNDMPGETKNSSLLAESQGCPKQIIRYQPLVYGFQCHMEITKDGMQQLIEACPKDLQASTFVQDSATLLKQDYASINKKMALILNRLVLKSKI